MIVQLVNYFDYYYISSSISHSSPDEKSEKTYFSSSIFLSTTIFVFAEEDGFSS